MTDHHLSASVETCHWGFFDPDLSPVLTVASGDQVTIETVSGGPDILPDGDYHIPPELLDINARSERELPGHILTGPVAVEGAEPGDMLEVRIDDVRLRQDWGWNFIRPLAGTLPEHFHEPHLTIIDLDAETNLGRLPWGIDLPLAPFFGVMGVAPPTPWGRISSIQPRAHGGNIDNKELVAGTVLYLPVFQPGAMFSCGDGHGVQGDGEVNVTAIETALSGTFTLTVHKGAGLEHPEAETPTHLITMDMHPDLDRCAEQALLRMISLITARSTMTREQAYTLCSLAADLRITQTVNGNKGVHCVLAKDLVDGG
ncbi:MAG: acetamidase/formamidase family protein [Pseudomonadota bacterium]